VVLPSPEAADVTCTTFGGWSTLVIWIPRLSARIDSLYRDSGFTSG